MQRSPLEGAARRVLLVEDNTLVAETIEVMLEDFYRITIADSVHKALVMLRAEEHPDVILLDCLLPGGNIPTLLAEADQQRLPVVLISGDPREPSRIDPQRPFLAKPFQRADLLRMLGAVG